MTFDRRTLLKTGLATAAVVGPFAGFVQSASAAVFTADPTVGLGPVPDARDGKVRLHLPEGFRYRSFHDTEQTVELDDGTILPGRHDGMGAFDGPGDTVFLIRNHEVGGSGEAFGPREPYDAAAQGGTTTIQVTKQGEVLRSWTSLNGTMMNCSGGIMPWRSWVTCEETVNGPDVGPDFTGQPNTGLEKPHGYIYEVPVGKRSKGRAPGKPIKNAGRFAHEAVAWEPESGALYMTEDNYGFASGFYRYTPKKNPERTGKLSKKGKLEMLAIKGEPNKHLEASFERGTKFPVTWVSIDTPDPDFEYTPGETAPTTNNEALTFVSSQGWAKGAAYFSRLEGQVAEDGVVFFTSTQGGGAAEPDSKASTGSGYGKGNGQVWAYDARKETLELIYQSPGPDVLDFPDNITTRNGTLVLCEDGGDDNYVRALRPDGTLVNVAWNQLYVDRDGKPETPPTDRTDDEFAGSTFSPDGKTLFVNIQASRGLTFAIWGPWESLGM